MTASTTVAEVDSPRAGQPAGPERYAIGLLALVVAGAIGLGFALSPSSGAGLLILAGAVIVTAWFGGTGPGLATSLLATAASGYSWLPAYGHSIPPHVAGAILLLSLELGLVSLLISRLRAQRSAARVTAPVGLAADSAAAAASDSVASELAILERLGLTLATHLDLEPLVKAVTDAGVAATGAAFGAFLYRNSAGLYAHSVSGAPREAFVDFPLFGEANAFGSPFLGSASRSDDLDTDPRFGPNLPFKQMPAGISPARSFLAAPVRSGSGELLGGLFFGHPHPAVFHERDERLVASLAAHAAIAVDNASLYREAQAARASAEEASRVKDEFLATLSHELRTPLTAIVGWAYLLQRGQLGPAEIPGAIETIIRSAKSQSQIIDELLDVSRIVTGKLRLDLEPVEIGEIVKSAIATVTPAANVKEVLIQLIQDPAGTSVLGDPDRLQQVLWNLLSNAVKFTPKGGRVRVTIQSIASRVEVSVADTGIGIDSVFLPHVFTRFSQKDSSSTRTVRGLGLGLAIARQLVELHGGSIQAESPGLGQGSTFTVEFPRSPVTAVPESGRVHSLGVRSSSHEEVPDLQGIRVLVVEDDADARSFVAKILEQEGASVKAVSSADEALAALECEPIDVVLSDIEMPGTDGYQFMRELRRRPTPQGGSVPAAALTAYARTEDRLRALRAGFQLHLSKPAEPAELVAVVASLANRRK